MISIIDNAISEESMVNIENMLFSPYFPWYYQNEKVYDSDSFFQFTHLFYDDYKPNCPQLNNLDPILQVIKPHALIRIKANLTTRHSSIVKFPLHCDFEYTESKTAIFYCNTNNGYTYFEDGTVVESVRNRLVIFNCSLKHSGTTHTDSKVRCVINFNYYS